MRRRGRESDPAARSSAVCDNSIMTLDLDVAARVLRIVTPVSATIAVATVIIGVLTSAWLYSEEKMPNPKFNRTGDPELEFLSKYTASGLWSLCYTNPGESSSHCFNIDYFPSEDYSPDPNDSTMAIPYAVIRSAPFFFAATVLLVVGEVSCFIGHFAKRRYFVFVAGVVLIVSGLFLLLGFVVYVSVFTAEIGSKLRPSSSLQPPMFTYTYGYSFHMVVAGFLAVEVAGTSGVFLFIYSHRNRWAKKESHRKMALALIQGPLYDLNPVGEILPPGSSTSIPRPKQGRQSDNIRRSNASAFICDNCACPSQRASSYMHHLRGCHVDDTLCNGGARTSFQMSPLDGDIPTPPPAITHHSCPVHHVITLHKPPVRTPSCRSFVSEHSPSSMPDITTLGHYGTLKKQHSTDTDSSLRAMRHQGTVTDVQQDNMSFTVCHECRGAGHVSRTSQTPQRTLERSRTVVSAQDFMSLPRNVTMTTVSTTVDLESTSNLATDVQHQQTTLMHQPIFGSLRRITPV